jgi:hypothetical protein
MSTNTQADKRRAIETLKAIAAGFENRRKFTATKRVMTEAIEPDRTMCRTGDQVVVDRWYCFKGPTSIKVEGRSFCVPFEWVLKAGAPHDLLSYMPYAPKTWAEIIEEAEQSLTHNETAARKESQP